MYRPNLNGFLLVYVYDNYPDYVVKIYLDCIPEENDKIMMVNPQEIAGEQINAFSRIASIADVFDAISHKRCYIWKV